MPDPKPQIDKESGKGAVARFTGMGIELAASTLVIGAIGYGFDRYINSKTAYGTAIGLLVGFVLGMVRFIIQVTKENKRALKRSSGKFDDAS